MFALLFLITGTCLHFVYLTNIGTIGLEFAEVHMNTCNNCYFIDILLHQYFVTKIINRF